MDTRGEMRRKVGGQELAPGVYKWLFSLIGNHGQLSQRIKRPPSCCRLDLPYDPAILFVGIYLKKTKTLDKKDMTPLVHCSTTYNSQDVETTYVSISG